MARLFPPFQQFFDDNGQPLTSGTLQFTVNGVISAPLDTFSDPSLGNKNSNPVVLNADGRLPFDIWGDGVYSVILKTKAGTLINQLDTVGGDVGSRTAFSDWTTTIVYNIPAFVVGSDGLYYRSLSVSNLGNDPTLNPGTNLFWEEFKFRGIWNNSITYLVGDVVQSTLGNVWKAMTSQSATDPETDDGTNWLPSISVQWTNKSSAFNVLAGKKYQIDASGGAVDAPFAASYLVGDVIIVHNESISTNLVRLTNSTLTIKGVGDTVTSSDNLELAPGDTAHLVAKTTTILEVV